MATENVRWKQIITEYRNRYITREFISKSYGFSMNHINKMLRYHKIKIWDNPRIQKITREMGRRIRNEMEYKSAEQIANEYGLELERVKKFIERWKKEDKVKKPKVIKDNSKYYDPRKDRSNYARMFYEFNN